MDAVEGEESEVEVEELMAAGRRLLELLPAEDREEVVGVLNQGASPVAAHLLARIAETRRAVRERASEGEESKQARASAAGNGRERGRERARAE